MPENYGSLPFKEQIEFLRQKVNLPSRFWTDLQASGHDVGFMVSGAMKEALLNDLRNAIDKVAADGKTFDWFKKNFRQIVADNGWAYRGEENWRAQVIYDTNLNQSYNAGREAQMADPELRRFRPYGLYKHYHSLHERAEHVRFDEWVILLSDPWWETYSPQNGWGCKCKKFALSLRDVLRRGLKIIEGPPIQYVDKVIGKNTGRPETVRVPVGVDPGFDYRPGDRPLAGLTPSEREATIQSLLADIVERNTFSPLLPLPPPRPFATEQLLPGGDSPESYVERFLQAFGASMKAPIVFADKAGAPLVIDSELFRDRSTGNWKVDKRGRERFLLMLAETIKDPDEIVLVQMMIGDKVRVRRRFIARWSIDGEVTPGLAVFEIGADGWAGITTFAPDELAYLDKMREGFRIYGRGE